MEANRNEEKNGKICYSWLFLLKKNEFFFLERVNIELLQKKDFNLIKCQIKMRMINCFKRQGNYQSKGGAGNLTIRRVL